MPIKKKPMIKTGASLRDRFVSFENCGAWSLFEIWNLLFWRLHDSLLYADKSLRFEASLELLPLDPYRHQGVN